MLFKMNGSTIPNAFLTVKEKKTGWKAVKGKRAKGGSKRREQKARKQKARVLKARKGQFLQKSPRWLLDVRRIVLLQHIA